MTRNEQMVKYYKNGWILKRIGQKYGVTRERVRQILKVQGITGKDGGQAIQMKRAQPAKDRAIQRLKDKAKANVRKRIFNLFGCSLELWEELGGHKWRTTPCGGRDRRGFPIQNYLGVKSLSKQRGTIFNLTLKQWWDIWTKSGKWEQRGAKREQYVLARINKNLPIQGGNVKIVKAKDSKDVE